MAGERPDWEWYRRAGEQVAAGNLEGAEQTIAAALDAGHLWRVSLLQAPALQPLGGRPGFEATAAEARRRASALNLRPTLLVELPEKRTGIAPLLLSFHGAIGNAGAELERWRPATELGFIVAAAQSSQPATEDGFCWDPPRERVWQDVRAIVPSLPAHGRTVLAGFSQGAWVALNLALDASLIVAGSVVMVAPFAALNADLPAAWRRLKVSILIGEHDQYRDVVEKVAARLSERQHHVALEVIPGLGHAYPADLASRLPDLLRP